MPVGREEDIVEGFVSRGIGVSGITSRAVQQSNIEELKSLPQAVSTSRATLTNIAKNRKSERNAAALRASSLSGRRSRRSGGGQGGSSSANFVLSASPGDQPGAGDGAQNFLIRGKTVDGNTFTKGFARAEDLQAYLQENPEIAKSLAVTAGDPVFKRLDSSSAGNDVIRSFVDSLPRLTGENAIDLAGTIDTPRATVGGSLGLGGTKKGTKTDRPSNPIDIVKTGIAPTRSEKARVVEAGLNRVLSDGFTDQTSKGIILQAIRSGKGFEAISEAIKFGGFL